jgi:predicted SAM-dependent methyltransferase
MRKLEIGGGTIKRKGYEQLDIVPGPDIDIVCDAIKLDLLYPETFDEIYCRNVIEHFPYARTVEVLQNWLRALKPGGKLICDTPMLLPMIDDYLKGKNNFIQLVNRLYGGQETKFDFHYAGFDVSTIESCFAQAGFLEIKTTMSSEYSAIVEGRKRLT